MTILWTGISADHDREKDDDGRRFAGAVTGEAKRESRRRADREIGDAG